MAFLYVFLYFRVITLAFLPVKLLSRRENLAQAHSTNFMLCQAIFQGGSEPANSVVVESEAVWYRRGAHALGPIKP